MFIRDLKHHKGTFCKKIEGYTSKGKNTFIITHFYVEIDSGIQISYEKKKSNMQHFVTCYLLHDFTEVLKSSLQLSAIFQCLWSS